MDFLKILQVRWTLSLLIFIVPSLTEAREFALLPIPTIGEIETVATWRAERLERMDTVDADHLPSAVKFDHQLPVILVSTTSEGFHAFQESDLPTKQKILHQALLRPNKHYFIVPHYGPSYVKSLQLTGFKYMTFLNLTLEERYPIADPEIPEDPYRVHPDEMQYRVDPFNGLLRTLQPQIRSFELWPQYQVDDFLQEVASAKLIEKRPTLTTLLRTIPQKIEDMQTDIGVFATKRIIAHKKISLYITTTASFFFFMSSSIFVHAEVDFLQIFGYIMRYGGLAGMLPIVFQILLKQVKTRTHAYDRMPTIKRYRFPVCHREK